MYSHCRTGGRILGNTIDGTQAEYVRIPYADTGLCPLPANGEEEAAVMLSDILPTGFECGVLNGMGKPGDTIAVGAACGIGALMTAQFTPRLRSSASTWTTTGCKWRSVTPPATGP